MLAQGICRGRDGASPAGWIALRAGMLAAWLVVAMVVLCACVTEASATRPADPSFPLQWGDSNTGQSIPTQNANEELGSPRSGTPGADNRVTSAWSVSTGVRSVVIAELDSGVQYSHPDLAANIWSNPGGIGGCPAGTHGFDALDVTCYPQDEDESYGGHGTHVAGIMGAVANNGLGVAGINWATSILPVKWVQSAGSETDELVGALQWILRVSQEGVNIRVVNDSLTFFGTPYSPEVKKAIEALGQRNILFVTAAGNTGNNNDEESVRRYPCGYDLSNEICATAVNNRDELPSWANYGPHTVDLAAPGESIYSTLREGRYGYLSGGSMASAQVSGAAALLLSVEPFLTSSELRTDLLGNVRPLRSLAGKVITGGTLDVCKAMPGCEHAPLPSVTALAPSSLLQTSVTLNADVNPNGREVSSCRFDYGSSSDYGTSAPCKPMPGNGTSPVEVSTPIEGLSPNAVYHFRIVASTSAGTSAGADQTFTTPPYPPSVTALAPSSLLQTSATLNAIVDPQGSEVSDCHFDYGNSSQYGASAQCTPMPGNGSGAVEVSASISGLSANTTYHFRLVASNRGGSSAGDDQRFTTAGVAGGREPWGEQLPPAETHGKTAPSPTQATLPYRQAAKPLSSIPTLLGVALKASSLGGVRVMLACPAGVESCVGAIELRVLTTVRTLAPGATRTHKSKRRISLVAVANGNFTIPAGGAVAETLALSHTGQALLARMHVLRGTVTLLVRDLTGRMLSTEISVTVKATANTRRTMRRAHARSAQSEPARQAVD